jgi:hypothetical protein
MKAFVRPVLRILGMGLVAALVGACSTPSQLTSKETVLLNDKTGLIVATLGFEVAPGSEVIEVMPSISLIAEPVSKEGAGGDVSINTASGLSNTGGWDEIGSVTGTPASKRLLVAFPAKPGQYAIKRKVVGLYAYNLRSEDPRPLVFTVKAGEIAYIGAHYLQYTTTINNGRFKPAPLSGEFLTRDQQAADLSLLVKLRPELKDAPVSNQSARR